MNQKIHQNKKQPLRKHVGRGVKLAVVPHEANDYQPHLIRRYGLLVALVLIIGVQLFFNFGPKGAVLSNNADVSQAALVKEANKAREQQEVDNLRLNEKLNEAAYYKAMDMFDKQYWGHDAPDGTKPWEWLAKVGYSYTKAGENLAKNFYTAESVTAAWMKSSEHRANILDSEYTEVGFAVATGHLDEQATTIIVALYGRPPGATGIVTTGPAVAGALGESPSLVARLGIGFQSMTPVTVGSIILLSFLMMVAFAAHLYREYIPVASHNPRHRHHHGAIKMGLMFAVIIGMMLLYGGGQL